MHWGFKLTLALLVGVPLAIYLLSRPSTDHLTSAREALTRRDFAHAQRELDALLTQSPHHLEALLLAAQTARRAGELVTAERHRLAFRAAGGSREEAELEEALRDSQQGNVGNAEQLLSFCRRNPDNPATPMMLEALAQGLLKTRNPLLALECLELWLKQSPSVADQAQGHVWRGQALEMQGLAPEAAEEYRKALQLDAKHEEGRLRLAQFLTRDNPAEALALFEQLDAEKPGQTEVRLHRARCYRLLGELSKAEQLLGELRPQQSDNLNILIEAGALAIDQGKPAAAEPLLRKAVTLAPNRRDPNVELMRCLRALRNDDEARQQEAKVKQIDDDIQRKIDAFSRMK